MMTCKFWTLFSKEKYWWIGHDWDTLACYISILLKAEWEVNQQEVKKINGATPQRGIIMGAHLPVAGCWAHRWINHGVCDAWPVRRQTYGYLPSLRRYQIYTAWWQLTSQDINPIAYAPEFTWPNFHAQAQDCTQVGTLARPVST